MDSESLKSTLSGIVGHIVIETVEQKRQFENLHKSLSKTSLFEERDQLKATDFSIEKSDLFFDEKIPKKQLDSLNLLAKVKSEKEEKPEFRVFVREVPIREQLIHGSVPLWATGAKLDHSIGPFKTIDGRQFWYDFFRVEELITLYVQGISEPALLFKVKKGRVLNINFDSQIGINLTKTYDLTKGSIWINSQFIAPNAPSGTYTGLSIKEGKIKLSKQPVNLNNKLTVTASTTVTVDLILDQPKVTGADKKSIYGRDARNMKLQLPKTLKFHFSAQGRTIDKVGNASWQLYGQSLEFKWNNQKQVTYDAQLQRILFPFNSSEQNLEINKNASKFNVLDGSAEIAKSAWALTVASIDITKPTAASSNGAMFVQGKEGLVTKWQGIKGGGLNLKNPSFLAGPGQILVADLTALNPHASQSLDLWKDESNEFGTKVELTFPSPTLFFYASNADGNELLMTFTNADFQIDRPVQVNCEPPTIRSLNSLLLIAVNKTTRLIYLFDDNLIQDAAQLSDEYPIIPKPMAFAMTNALFKVSQVNGCLMFGSLSPDHSKVENGFLFLTFGLYAYLPSLPDPYAANLGALTRQLRGNRNFDRIPNTAGVSSNPINAWLVCRVKWNEPAQQKGPDDVEVSFHFAPLTNQFSGISLEDQEEEPPPPNEEDFSASESLAFNTSSVNADILESDPEIFHFNLGISNTINVNTVSTTRTDNITSDGTDNTTKATTGSKQDFLPDYGKLWDKFTRRYTDNLFALLDVSTNADLYGISFNLFSRKHSNITTHVPVNTVNSQFPVQVKGLDVVSTGQNVKSFTVPQISWEPVLNLSPPQPGSPGDPNVGHNYYPNDGGPTQILNNNTDTVVLAPIPLNHFLTDHMENTDGFFAFSFFTLPFGMRALALLQKEYDSGGGNTRRGGILSLESEEYDDDIKAANQLTMTGGEAQAKVESDMFAGRTIQIANVLDLDGTTPANLKSTLGQDVTKIFNNEFSPPIPDFFIQRGVPLERIDLSGYGASAFSNWFNPKAAIAETSQAKFDIFLGRCAHEVIQVKSIMYPWGIQVVRTITLFRVGSGYVYRFDTGWRAESDGLFNFKYFTKEDDGSGNFDSVPQSADFEIHPGLINGLFNVKDISGTDEVEPFFSTVIPEFLVDESTGEGTPNNGNVSKPVELQPVFFNADIEIENPTSGFNLKKFTVTDKNGEKSEKEKTVVPSKKILGFVQIGPRGVPITSKVLGELVFKYGSIGGPIDCEVNLANSNQKMRLNRFDFNNSVAANGADPVFAVAGRGNVLLPKDGSWSLVEHNRDTGDVSPVSANLSVPVIREGFLEKDGETQKLQKPIKDALLRIANPPELLRNPASDTLNYGFLQSTDTQKALFLTPSFELGKKKLYSKTPPLFVDAFRIVNSKFFPNIGDGENNLGEAISLIKNGNEFLKGGLQDIGQDVWELMDVEDVVENVKQQGYKLLKEVTTFDLPDTEFELIDAGDGNFRVYIEYVSKDEGNNDVKGDLDFSINSFANDVADTWKSRMGNIGLVVDLAGIERLITIRGSWDSKKGSEASYPQPELVFADELEPVIKILEILQQLQGGDYAGAVGNGIKLAMSNKAGSWEYKFEASKEIPVLRFPVPDAIYNDPNTPFKLEAGLTIGAYFNAAISVTNNANELLPSAGGLLGFYGRLSVMCVSLSAATVYAIGQVNLDIAADTKIGPSLRMKFGFGAQIVIGLPVAGNVSVSFVVGVEIFAAEGIIEITAFMLFEGHAEILGGIVSITITIEAKGTISKKAVGNGSRTDLACQVTFGLDISIFLIINISFETSWSEERQIAGSS